MDNMNDIRADVAPQVNGAPPEIQEAYDAYAKAVVATGSQPVPIEQFVQMITEMQAQNAPQGAPPQGGMPPPQGGMPPPGMPPQAG